MVVANRFCTSIMKGVAKCSAMLCWGLSFIPGNGNQDISITLQTCLASFQIKVRLLSSHKLYIAPQIKIRLI